MRRDRLRARSARVVRRRASSCCSSLLAIAAPLVARHDPFGIDLVNSLQPPSRAHWFGTDIQGRDVWARLVYGARVSLSVGIVSQGIALSLGVLLGLIAGYYGRWVDELVMRLADVTLAFPTLLLLIALVAALQPSLTVVFVTIGVVGWAGMARLVRGQVLVVRELEFVQAERALGARDYAHHPAARAAERHRAGRDRRRRSAWPARSWPSRRCRFSGSACSRRRRAGAR